MLSREVSGEESRAVLSERRTRSGRKKSPTSCGSARGRLGSARRCAGRALPLPRSARRPRREGARPADVRRGDWQRPALYRAAGGLAPLSQERSRFSSKAGERPRAGVSRGAAGGRGERGAERGRGTRVQPGEAPAAGAMSEGRGGAAAARGAGRGTRGGRRGGAERSARVPRSGARSGADTAPGDSGPARRRPAPGAGSAEVALAAPPGLGPPPPRRARLEAPRGPAGRRGRGTAGKGLGYRASSLRAPERSAGRGAAGHKVSAVRARETEVGEEAASGLGGEKTRTELGLKAGRVRQAPVTLRAAAGSGGRAPSCHAAAGRRERAKAGRPGIPGAGRKRVTPSCRRLGRTGSAWTRAKDGSRVGCPKL